MVVCGGGDGLQDEDALAADIGEEFHGGFAVGELAEVCVGEVDFESSGDEAGQGRVGAAREQDHVL